MDRLPGRKIIIVCDGSDGESSHLLGLGDEFEQLPCQAYGSVATIKRHNESCEPTPERKVVELLL